MGLSKIYVSLLLLITAISPSQAYSDQLDLPYKPLTSGWSGGKYDMFMNMSNGIAPDVDSAVITYMFRPGLERSASNGTLVSFGTSEKCNELTPEFSKHIVNATVVVNGVPLKANRNCGSRNKYTSSVEYNLVTDAGVSRFEEIMMLGSELVIVFDGDIKLSFQNYDGKAVASSMRILESAK